MPSRHETTPAGLAGPGLLADYLDHLCAPLVGVLPYSTREELRLEISAHLEALADDLEAQGYSPEAALAGALREFGEPWSVGEAILREASWRAGEDAAHSPRAADGHALAWFGPPAAFCMLLLTQHAVGAHDDRLAALFWATALLTPALSGLLTGFTAPAGAALGAARVHRITGLFALAVGIQLLPSAEGLLFLGMQLGYSLPVGWLAARGAVVMRRQYRRERFLRMAGQGARTLERPGRIKS